MPKKLSCEADAGLVEGIALVKAQQKRDRPMNRTIRNGIHLPVQQHIYNMAKKEPTVWLDALPQEYGSLGRDPFKDGPNVFLLVKFSFTPLYGRALTPTVVKWNGSEV
ncbi:hypothetical protein IV203_009540 [Nitzschia inconspicua]|uniref:Uncharacterized protein n=1 Tax=Nitzschia inconspicua TaxID=303405 RepID=A0A9K3KUH4_9STRA|nr:hypothetical protein IV203_009540 [Nitzschia inconspicua]